MCFTTTKGSAQLQHPITTPPSQNGQDISQDTAEFSGEIGSLEEGMGIPVDRAHAAIALHHFAEVSSVAVHGKLALDNIDMWRGYAVPGKQFCSTCMSMCRHDSNPCLSNNVFTPTRSCLSSL